MSHQSEKQPQVIVLQPEAREDREVFVVRQHRQTSITPVALLAVWLIGMPFVASVALGIVNVLVLIAATVWWSRRR